MIKVISKEVLSSDKIHSLQGKIYIPEGSARGLFHVVHGMTEHIARYDDFMRAIAEAGYIVFGYDHLGHGKTAVDRSELGFFAPENGWERLVDDVFLFGNEIRKLIGGELPFILMGHSMGSFIVRLTAAKYNHYDRLIIMGTGGPNPASGAGIALAKRIKKLKGDHYISKFIYKMAFGAYNQRFKSENDKYAWLSTMIEDRDSYRSDPYCTFLFTVSAMEDLIRLNKNCNEKAWFDAVDMQKPILVVSGAEDPVGDYGGGVKKVYDSLRSAGANVQMKLYEGCRHEILNDVCRNEVTADIIRFIG